MNALLLTVLTLGGADAAAAHGGGHAAGYGDQCDDCNGDGHGHHWGRHGGWLGPMPQSCYNPSFGCYASTRFMHRYPAFHNYYYRAAYNYRTYFDYPWHAGLHEPTSLFSYHVPGEAPTDNVPRPAPAASRPKPGPIRSAAASEPVDNPYYGER